MGCTCFHGFALVCSVAALGLTLGALTTTSWITVTISFEDALSTMKGLVGQSDDSVWDVVARMYDGINIFYGQGLIRESISAGHLFHLDVFVDAQKTETFILVTSFVFIVAALISFIGIIILLCSVCGGNSYEAKSSSGSRTRTAMIVLGVSGFLLLFAMALYTGASSNEVHHPVKFMATFEKAGEQALRSVTMNKFGDMKENFNSIVENSIWDRNKRDISYGPMEMMSQILRNVDPVYGYSFIMGWVASVLMLISALLTAAARHQLVHQPYGMTVKA